MKYNKTVLSIFVICLLLFIDEHIQLIRTYYKTVQDMLTIDPWIQVILIYSNKVKGK